MNGTRKARATWQSQVILLAGFIAACAFSVPETLFAAFVAGLVGNLTAFSWANVKVHQTTGGNEGEPAKTKEGGDGA